ncbi:unnamed protein product [Phytophthora lilii]|uniref:Unnamed protein product n=1 Tax=Phytophthora lilii TaxID=2077276 RepID=A0A9W6TIY0_9STRA|nr:unnamed protein product [Phytophthora lilii]
MAVADIAVPGEGLLAEVLAKTAALSRDVNEAKNVCEHLQSGLISVMDELQTREKEEQLPSSELLDKFVAVAVTFLRYLQRYQGKEAVYRVVEYEKMLGEERQINESVAELFELFHVVTVNWEEQWEHAVNVQKDLLTASAKDTNAHGSEIMECIKAMMTAITAASKAISEELPPWFIPLYDITYETKEDRLVRCIMEGGVQEQMW